MNISDYRTQLKTLDVIFFNLFARLEGIFLSLSLSEEVNFWPGIYSFKGSGFFVFSDTRCSERALQFCILAW